MKVVFEQASIDEGTADANTSALFEQFYVDLDVLRSNIKMLLRTKPQVSLSELLEHYKPTKGIAEILGYMQIATSDSKHLIANGQKEKLDIQNSDTGEHYQLEAPLVIYNR